MLPSTRAAVRRSGRCAVVATGAPALVLVLVLGLLAAFGTTTSYAAEKDPSQDLPVIPASCSDGASYINPSVRPCRVNRWKAGRPTMVLWGDSHALQMMPAVQRAVRGGQVNLALFALGSCPPMKYDRVRGDADLICKDFNADALAYVTDLQRRGKPVRVVLGGLWQGYRNLHEGLFETRRLDRSDYPGYVVEVARVFPKRAPALLRRLGRLGVDVDVIGQTATVPRKGLRTCRAGETPFVCDLPRRKALPQEGATRAWLKNVMKPLTNRSRLIDPNSAYCDASVCQGRKGGIHTFFNDLHISATRAKTMKRFFLPGVRALKRQP